VRAKTLDIPMTDRFAIYFAPPRGSTLDRFGCAWLGRDTVTGSPVPRPAVDGLTDDAIQRITAQPARYGLHATLKPPFRLVPGRSAARLREMMAAFAADRARFVLPPLHLGRIGSFLALVPTDPCPEMDRLAADCVKTFDGFRAPADANESRRRRDGGLTPQQESYLDHWGYPYVMSEYRFHITLTGSLDPAMLEAARKALAPLVDAAAREAQEVTGISLFVQSNGEPFRRAVDFSFAAA
jgi:putative phosphonate metabolism protein